MPRPEIRAARVEIAPDAEFGEDVRIEADELIIGPGARIGFSGADDFRTPPGVRIRAGRLEIGAAAEVGRSVRMEGGDLSFDAGVRVLRHATIKVVERLHIGAFGTVGEQCEISGRHVEIGQELWMLPQAKIGGGSAFERASRLEAGHFLHLGVQTLINTARPVRIGHEVGLGTRTSIYTHGAYSARLQGFPVSFAGVEIGDFTWVPGATINPGVRIGRNCVIGVNSLVTKDIPDGSLAAGSPAAVIREGAYPRPLEGEKRLAFYEQFLRDWAALLGSTAVPARDGDGVWLATEDATYGAAPSTALSPPPASTGRLLVLVGDGSSGHPPEAWTVFDTVTRRIRGRSDGLADRLTNELRRYGIRFYSRPRGQGFVDWEPEPPRFLVPEATQAEQRP